MNYKSLNINFNLNNNFRKFITFKKSQYQNGQYDTFGSFAQDFIRYYKIGGFIPLTELKGQLDEVVIGIFNPELLNPNAERIAFIQDITQRSATLEEQKIVIVAFSVFLNHLQPIQNPIRFPLNELYLRKVPPELIGGYYSLIISYLNGGKESIINMRNAIELGFFSIAFEEYFPNPLFNDENIALKHAITSNRQNLPEDLEVFLEIARLEVLN